MSNQFDSGRVVSLGRSATHTFAKPPCREIRLLEGLGVEGDAHAGATVKHRSRVARDPNQPNLRQVHLIPIELLHDLRTKAFDVQPGDIGENVLTEGLDLFALPRGARLQIGSEALVEVTGLRNPCHQLDDFKQGLMHALLPKGEDGKVRLRGGIMGTVLRGGTIRVGDDIVVTLPLPPLHALERV